MLLTGGVFKLACPSYFSSCFLMLDKSNSQAVALYPMKLYFSRTKNCTGIQFSEVAMFPDVQPLKCHLFFLQHSQHYLPAHISLV
uniref:Uncharacterized protein n=1 Tax=Aegilops tauschii subsp. strangulata TaxID=200361 RepID=A0A453MB06_AEGTS